MKFFHLSDIHLGKKVNGFSMIEDQQYILRSILEAADSEKPDAVVIAGDIYDRTYPSPKAVALYDEFLYQLSEKEIRVFAVSGNHDSAERVAFGSRILSRDGIFLSPVYDGRISPVVMNDEYGAVCFYMIPFVRPADVRPYFPDDDIETYNEAVQKVVEECGADFSMRNVMITHQFVAGAKSSDSEEVTVGGTTMVNAGIFDGFDYVALGHLHRPQNIKRDTLRYCGTPLKYSVSEENDCKSITVVELREKGDTEVRTIPLTPLHDVRTIRGHFDELVSTQFDCGGDFEDYLHIVLTDEDDIPDAIGRLRSVYPNVMALEYDNTRTRNLTELEFPDEELSAGKSPEEMFAELYRMQNGREMSDEETEAVHEIMSEIQEAGR